VHAAKHSFYRAASGIFSKLGLRRTASEEVVIQLIQSKSIPAAITCIWPWSIAFDKIRPTIARLCQEQVLYETVKIKMNTVKNWSESFSVSLPSCLTARRTEKFPAKYSKWWSHTTVYSMEFTGF